MQIKLFYFQLYFIKSEDVLPIMPSMAACVKFSLIIYKMTKLFS